MKTLTLAITAVLTWLFCTAVASASSTTIPDADIAAIASPLRSLDGKPFNVIITPQIKDDKSNLAKGVHTIQFTLAADSPSAFVINGVELSPGETVEMQQNLSLTGHRLRIEAYPVTSGIEMAADYTITIPDIKITVCPESFNYKASEGKCHLYEVIPAGYDCPSPFALTGGTKCQWLFSYPAESTCAAGYTANDLACSKDITLPLVTTCPENHGLDQSKTSCLRHEVVDVENCLSGTYKDGMCEVDGTFTPSGLYCDGFDVSSGTHCQGGECYHYNSEWNACDVVTTVPVETSCAEGVKSGGQCLFKHTYNINAQCPFGYIRDGLNCSRLMTEPASKVCPDTFTLSNDASFCIKVVTEPFVGCPSGYNLIDGRCHETHPINIACPDTHLWNGSSCEQLITFDANPLCPEGEGWSHSTSQCDFFDTKEVESCADGYYFSGGDCYEVVSANQVCPLNYINNGSGVCEFNDSVPVATCPDNFNLVDGRCYAVLDADQSCLSSGFTIVDGKCRKDAVLPILSCQSGYQLYDEICYRVFDPIEICPAGYINDGNECVKTTNSDVDSCPTDMQLVNGQCYALVEANQLCPLGYTNNGSGICEKLSILPIQACPAGYVLVDEFCHAVENVPPQCEAGFSYIDGDCKKTELQAVESCPAGYQLSSGKCFSVYPATQRCSMGSVYPNGKCGYTVGITPKSCAEGFELNGMNCHKVEPSSLSCEDGGELINGMCHVSDTQQIIGCSAGHILDEGQCYKSKPPYVGCPNGFQRAGSSLYCEDKWDEPSPLDSDYDLYATHIYLKTSVARSYSVPSYYSATARDHYCKSRGYDYNEYQGSTTWCKKVDKPYRIYLSSPYSSHLSCPSGSADITEKLGHLRCDFSGETRQASSITCDMMYGYNASKQACLSLMDFTSTAGICPTGYSKDPFSGVCSQLTIKAPSTTCSPGSSLFTDPSNNSQICLNDIFDNSKVVCPIGFDKTSEGECEYFNETDLITECPGGSLIPNSTNCLANNANFSVGNCPANYLLNTNTGRCERHFVSPAQYICSSGFSLHSDGECRSDSPDLTQGICPTRFSLNSTNGTCEKLSSGPVAFQCDNGFSAYQTDKCLSNTPDNSGAICPAGFAFDSSSLQCVMVETYPIERQCSQDFNLTAENICRAISPTPSVGICPTNYALDTSLATCHRTYEEGIHYSCPAGFDIYQSNRCQSQMPDNAVGSCDVPGYSLNATTGLCDIHLTAPVDYQCPTAFSNHMVSECKANVPDFSRGLCELPHIINLANGNCEHIASQPFTYDCDPAPKGEPVTLTGAQCSYYDLTDETRSCNIYFSQYDLDTCQRDIPSDSIGMCNAPLEVLATHCEKTFTDSYTLQCDTDGYTLEGVQCSLLLEEGVTVSCNPGEQFVNGQCQRIEDTAETRTCHSPYRGKGIDKCERSILINSF